MDTPQLKTLATRIRELLKRSACTIGHSQALDLIAALPGLRNWPEVQAFPQRVSASRLDLEAASRLSHRIRKHHDVDLAPADVIAFLRPHAIDPSDDVLDIWPSGPAAGVYLTTSESAIAAFLDAYEDATDGSILYAERVARDHPSAIELDESGLWSNGLDRAPSGTLLVLGPVRLDQDGWRDAGERLVMACIRAARDRHRVAVLIDTPAPETLFEDARLLVTSASSVDDPPIDIAIRGRVTEEGGLESHPVPQYAPDTHPGPTSVPSEITRFTLPPVAVEQLRARLRQRQTGVLVIGTPNRRAARAIDILPDVLALSAHCGHAALISPYIRHDDPVEALPDAVRALPVLPSIQSAYARGYRRMVISATNTPSELLSAYPDVLFISTMFGSTVDTMSALHFGIGPIDQVIAYRSLVAIVGHFVIPSSPNLPVTDLAIPSNQDFPPGTTFETIDRHLLDGRDLAWEDIVERELRIGYVTTDMLRAIRPAPSGLSEFLARYDIA